MIGDTEVDSMLAIRAKIKFFLVEKDIQIKKIFFTILNLKILNK